MTISLPDSGVERRNRCVEEYLYLLRQEAFKLIWARGLSRSILIDDLVQAGALGLIRAAERYEDGPEFRALAGAAVRNAMSDWLRGEAGAQVDCPGQLVEECPLPDIQIREHQRRERLKSAIRGLPAVERTVIDRLYRDGAKQREVADELGVSQPRVAEIRKRAIERIRPAVIEAWAA